MHNLPLMSEFNWTEFQAEKKCKVCGKKTPEGFQTTKEGHKSYILCSDDCLQTNDHNIWTSKVIQKYGFTNGKRTFIDWKGVW